MLNQSACSEQRVTWQPSGEGLCWAEAVFRGWTDTRTALFETSRCLTAHKWVSDRQSGTKRKNETHSVTSGRLGLISTAYGSLGANRISYQKVNYVTYITRYCRIRHIIFIFRRHLCNSNKTDSPKTNTVGKKSKPYYVQSKTSVWVSSMYCICRHYCVQL